MQKVVFTAIIISKIGTNGDKNLPLM